MDYTQQSLGFKLRKAARYARLYGPRRTLVKIRSELHMRRRFDPLPRLRRPPSDRQHVGIIGCGKFAYAQVAYYLRRARGRVIRGGMDIDVNRAASLALRYGLAYYTDDSARVIDDPGIDLIYITSNHASHADYAVRALERGAHVHIEKPHVVTLDQLRRLCSAMESTTGRVNLGFNRPGSRFGETIKAALDREPGPAMLNWSIIGHAIPADHWYYGPEEGGHVLGNLCHWTDFVLRMVPAADRYPIAITPTRGAGDADLAVTFRFGDGTIAAITFSSKGHAFEGVRERLTAHKGDTIVRMDDFERLTIERGPSKRTTRRWHRDHGHRENILRSSAMARPDRRRSFDTLPTSYVWETGELFLMTREALESRSTIEVESFTPQRLRAEAARAAT